MWAPEPTRTPPRPQTAVVATTHEHQLRPRPYVVGYSGYIPGLMFQYGRTFAKAAEDCVVTFLKQQEGKTATAVVQTERRCKSLPRMRSVRGYEGGRSQTFTYATDVRYPPLPGYTGHIPNVTRSTVIGRSVASATRRERDRSAVMEEAKGRTQEKSVERYQEQTASSRAKQVTIIKPQSELVKSVEMYPGVNDYTGEATKMSGVSSDTIKLISNSREEGKAVAAALTKDNVKMVLAGQIRCDNCEDVIENSSEIASEGFTEVKFRSSSAETHRLKSFRSSLHQTAGLNVSQRESSTSSRNKSLNKNISPSKRAKQTNEPHVTSRSLSRSKSSGSKTTKSSSPDAHKRTMTTQTSYQKSANPSITTQTSVQPTEDKTAKSSKSSSKVKDTTHTTKPKDAISETVGKGITFKKETHSNVEDTQNKSIPDVLEKQSTDTSSNPDVKKESALKSPIPITKQQHPQFESHINLSSSTAKETHVI